MEPNQEWLLPIFLLVAAVVGLIYNLFNSWADEEIEKLKPKDEAKDEVVK